MRTINLLAVVVIAMFFMIFQPAFATGGPDDCMLTGGPDGADDACNPSNGGGPSMTMGGINNDLYVKNQLDNDNFNLNNVSSRNDNFNLNSNSNRNDNDNLNLNSVNTSDYNSNWNHANANGTGIGVGEGGNAKQEQKASVENDINIVDNRKYRRNPVNSAYAGPLTSSDDTCMGSSTAGGQGMTFGLSLGTTWTDDNCVRRKDARELYNMGYKKAAKALHCQDANIKAAFALTTEPCTEAGANTVSTVPGTAGAVVGSVNHNNGATLAQNDDPTEYCASFVNADDYRCS